MAQILIDCREQADELRAALTRLHGLTVELRKLKYGDYHIYPDTIVERKTARDFCLSIIDGRLFRQAYQLARPEDTTLIIIEGEHLLAGHDINISLNAVRGALIALAQTYRIPVLRTHDGLDSAWHLAQLYRQRCRLAESRSFHFAPKAKRLNNQKRRIVATLPGVGVKTADLLLREFGSVGNIINASADDLLKVPGIGPKTVERIQGVLREQAGHYGIDCDGNTA